MSKKENTVLIVDDGKPNIDAMRLILEDKYNIRIALNGEAALRNLEMVKPDLVLLDVMMPGIDGFEVLAIMRKNPEWTHIPVIFITGDTDSYSEERGLLMGAVDYVRKPYNPDIVSIKVRNAILNKMHRDSLERLVEKRTAELSQSREAIIIGMSLLAEGRDQGTGEHIQRMKNYSAILAKKMNELYPDIISVEEVKNINLMSPLHDIGKVSIPDAILLKNGKLTFEEFEEIKKHTVFGAEILRKTDEIQGSSESLVTAIEIAESHHEKFDGSGYPHGLAGEAIPFSARIVALADIYDALTSERPYKKAFTHEEASDIILKGDGRTEPHHFDPRVLEAYKQSANEFIEISKIK